MNLQEILNTLQPYFPIACGVLLVLFVLFFVLFVRSVKKSKLEIRRQKTIIEEQMDEIENLRSKAHALDASKEAHRSLQEYTKGLETRIKLSEEGNEINSRALSESIDRCNALQGIIDTQEEDLRKASEDNLELVEKNRSLSETLKATDKKFLESEKQFAETLETLKTEKEQLQEEYSKFVEEKTEKIAKLSTELESEKEINSALTIALRQLSRGDLPQELPKTKKVDMTKEFKDMNKKELLLAARNLGLKNYRKMKKEDLVNALNEKLTDNKKTKTTTQE